MSHESKIKYHPNPLTAFENGAMMDLRMRLAVEFTKSEIVREAYAVRFTQHRIYREAVGVESVEQVLPPDEAWIACFSLNLAEELFKQGEERGWVEGMPDDDGHLNVGLRDHIKRNVKAQLYQNEIAQREQQNSAPQVQVPRGMFQQ